MFRKNERGSRSNIELIATVRRQLLELGVQSELHAPTSAGPDPGVHLGLIASSGAARTYAVQPRPRLTPELATAIHAHSDRPTLVVTTSITEQVGERLRERGIDYVDAAGNAHLAWDDVLIDVRGRRRSVDSLSQPSDRGARAFSRAGLQVQFTLLSWPDLAASPLRTLAQTSGVSLGTVKMVVDELIGAHYLHEGPNGRRLGRGQELLNRWSEAYSIRLGPSLRLADFVANDLSWWRQDEHELMKLGVQVGGEAAASILDPHLHPSSLTVYADELPASLIGRHRLVPQPGGGNVHVRRRFWTEIPGSWIVPSTLIYADLLASGDPRQREHADRIRSHDDRLAQLDRT